MDSSTLKWTAPLIKNYVEKKGTGQCCRSGSEFDPYSVGSADPDPDLKTLDSERRKSL